MSPGAARPTAPRPTSTPATADRTSSGPERPRDRSPSTAGPSAWTPSGAERSAARRSVSMTATARTTRSGPSTPTAPSAASSPACAWTSTNPPPRPSCRPVGAAALRSGRSPDPLLTLLALVPAPAATSTAITVDGIRQRLTIRVCRTRRMRPASRRPKRSRLASLSWSDRLPHSPTAWQVLRRAAVWTTRGGRERVGDGSGRVQTQIVGGTVG